ncbi:hypothetical protein Rsub_12997 [Raphidocelis subcapitata]|uniref:Uncharacterized protein n=1 Tax=Raphidocelis subcapitata TaxID=307507 RepID=A0A2V0PQC8_9CHLO|nr:hypothetical protein Rsub_12997 [Raphidocelis subcapitata]|eukprot:GBG00271.1 hypothetical protein Rsub_12997 [Raphidocelis subcapitata]
MQALSATWEPYHAAFMAAHDLAMHATAARRAAAAAQSVEAAAERTPREDHEEEELGQLGGESSGLAGSAAGSAAPRSQGGGGSGGGGAKRHVRGPAATAAAAAAVAAAAEAAFLQPAEALAPAAAGAGAAGAARQATGRAGWVLQVAPPDDRTERVAAWLMHAVMHGFVKGGRVERSVVEGGMVLTDGELPPLGGDGDDGDDGDEDASPSAPGPGSKRRQLGARSAYAAALSMALMLTQVGTGFVLMATWVSQQRRQRIEEEMEREGRALRLAHMRAALFAAAAEQKIAHAA